MFFTVGLVEDPLFDTPMNEEHTCGLLASGVLCVYPCEVESVCNPRRRLCRRKTCRVDVQVVFRIKEVVLGIELVMLVCIEKKLM